MTAGECYRFCLNSPHVDVVLSAPATKMELLDSLKQMERGPILADRMAEIRSARPYMARCGEPTWQAGSA